MPKSGLGKALRYALAELPAMQVYIEHGRVKIDNNGVENDIRPSAVGKKNWLFVGSPEAGQRGAAIYSLLISARNHGANPQAYLRDFIERCPAPGRTTSTSSCRKTGPPPTARSTPPCWRHATPEQPEKRRRTS